MNVRRHILFRLILATIICVLAFHRMQFLTNVLQHPTHSFISYYTASVLLTQDKDVKLFYNDRWFSIQVGKIAPQIEEYYTPNPPTTAFLLLPLASYSYDDARLIWTVFNIIFVAGAILFIFWKERFSLQWAMVAILLTLIYQPLWANLEYGQVYGVLFVITTIIWYAYNHRYDAIAGGLLGSIFIMKTAGLLLFPFLLVQRRWKALFLSMATPIIIVLLTLPIVGGIETWLRFAQKFSVYSQRMATAVTAYQSIPNFFKHHLTYHPTWNPSPLLDAPMLATILYLSVIAILVIITLRKSIFGASSKWVFCALVILTIVMSPATLDYHYTLLLLPILFLLADIGLMSRWQKIGFLLAVFLLSVDYPYQNALYEQTFLSLMAYPKLIGGLMLWMITVYHSQ